MTEISSANYHRWRYDPVTVALMERLEQIKIELQNGLLNEQVLMGDQKNIARLLGNIEALNLVLNINVEDMTEEEKLDVATSGT